VVTQFRGYSQRVNFKESLASHFKRRASTIPVNCRRARQKIAAPSDSTISCCAVEVGRSDCEATVDRDDRCTTGVDMGRSPVMSETVVFQLVDDRAVQPIRVQPALGRKMRLS